MIITRARLSDLPGIVDMERMGFDDQSQWSEGSWRSELERDDRCVLASKDPDGNLTGVATFQTVAEVTDLHRVMVRPDVRGRGVAVALLRAGIEWAEAMGAEQMVLEVEQNNEPALALYRKMGFEPLSKRSHYYGEGRHALVMVKSLSASDPWRVNARG